MELKLKRIAKRDTYTIGRLYIDGTYFCDTIEDKDRGLASSMPEQDIRKKKVYGKTAIPTGRYGVNITYSPRFAKKLPLIDGVKGFSGIRIHSGNTADDSSGCVIVGENKKKGMVINSKATLDRLLNKLSAQQNITITIE